MTLTELWKDGQLEDGFYYFRLPDGSIDIASEYRLIRYRLTKDADKIEVLAPVPSYEEWMRTKDSLDDYKRLCDMRGKIIDKMDESNEDTVKHLRQENAQLHKFLEEFNALDVAKENQQLKEEINKLKEAIYDLDGLECPKCGNYHRRGWTCSQCGYGK